MPKVENIISEMICNSDPNSIVFEKYLKEKKHKKFFEFLYKASLISYNKFSQISLENETYNLYRERAVKVFHNIDHQYWKNVNTYKKLQDGSIEFLKGNIGTTMFHGGPIDPETVQLLGPLIKINELGFVSIEGQPGECEYNIIGKPISASEQVSYIVGFYPRNRRNILGNTLAKKGFIASYSGNIESDKDIFAPVTTDLTLIKHVRYITEHNYDFEEWETHNLISSHYPSETGLIVNKKLKMWMEKNVDTWLIYDTVECREKLTPTLLEVLQNFGPIDFSASPI